MLRSKLPLHAEPSTKAPSNSVDSIAELHASDGLLCIIWTFLLLVAFCWPTQACGVLDQARTAANAALHRDSLCCGANSDGAVSEKGWVNPQGAGQ